MILNVVISVEVVNSEGQSKRLIADVEGNKYGLLICNIV